MSYRDDRYWEDPQYDADFGEYNNSEDDLAFDFFSNQQDLIRSRGWDFNEMVNAWDAYKASNRFYVFDEFLDSWDKESSAPVTGAETVANILKKLTVDPIGAGLLSKGISGFVKDFLVYMFKGDYSTANEKLDDVDNLVANLMMYLVARGVSQEIINKAGFGTYKTVNRYDSLGNLIGTNQVFTPDYTLMYQFSYVFKNQLSDIIWEGYSDKYGGAPTDDLAEYYRRIEELTGGFHWNIRTWSYSKGGNTKDAPASGGWIKSKFGDYYIRKNLF